VEVVAAKALMPKDGQGSTNAYCVVSFSSGSLGLAWGNFLVSVMHL
jgi:hypothetical protein